MIDDIKSAKKPAVSVSLSANDAGQTKTIKPSTDTFITPDEAAALDPVATTAVETTPPIPESTPKPPKTGKSWREKLKPHWPLDKREWAIGAGTVVLGGALIAVLIVHTQPKPVISADTKPKVVKKVVPPKPKTVASTLSGLQVDPTVNQRPVTGVMIENSTFARPQSGLSQAGVMFEAIAEGGITRFLALYQDTAPDNIGPIRSARPYYEQWALGFDAAYAHVGGSPEALANVKAWGIKDLDQFGASGSYHRVTTREAPHNVYTSVAALNQLETSRGYTSSTFTGFPRKAEAMSKTPNAKTVDLTLSGPSYNVHYDYNAADNSYRRSVGGEAQVDANTNTQLSPKVVVALVMTYGLQADGKHSEYNTIGSGTAYVFQDGIVATGTWSKASNAAQIVLSDSAGKPLAINPGQAWFTAVGGAAQVKYVP